MTAETWNNLVEMYLDQVETYGDKPALWAKRTRKDPFESLSWNDVAEQVAKLTRVLVDLGIEPGDRVALVCESRPEWVISDLAIMAAGAITVPTYITNSARDHEHILENSGAQGAVVSTSRLARAFLPAAHESDACQFVIAMEAPRISQSLNVDIHLWDNVMLASQGQIADVRTAISNVKRDDVACLIYTSGTGGAPKGVMISHGAILHNCAGARNVLEQIGIKDEVFLSFLPLSHAYEHTGGLYLPICIGAEIYYAEGIDKLAVNMEEVHPTIMTVVPRLFELLRNRVTRSIEEQGGFRLKLFERAVELGSKRITEPGSLNWRERMMDKLLDRLVRKKVQARFGGRVKALISGGAPLNPDVGLFFHALGLRLLQGYGQTESGPVVSCNQPNSCKMHTVGPPMKDTEVKIAEDGEILIRGELVMKGYWRDDDATAAALKDGWLHTGDIGIIDEDNHLQITDRKKDILVNDKGDNVSPARVEGLLTLEPEIAQAMIYGDRRPHMVAVLVPDVEWLETWSAAQGKSGTLIERADDPDLHDAIDEAVGRVNQRLSNTEKVRRFLLAGEPFSIENEQMTPKMSIRRHVIVGVYKDALEGLY